MQQAFTKRALLNASPLDLSKQKNQQTMRTTLFTESQHGKAHFISANVSPADDKEDLEVGVTSEVQSPDKAVLSKTMVVVGKKTISRWDAKYKKRNASIGGTQATKGSTQASSTLKRKDDTFKTVWR